MGFCTFVFVGCAPSKPTKPSVVEAKNAADHGDGITSDTPNAHITALSKSQLPPKSALQIEPRDLTSMAADVPLRISVNSVSEHRQLPQLRAVAARTRLVELQGGVQIPCNISVHEKKKNVHGEFGYPTTVPAYVGVEPASKLDPAKWYDLQVVSLPDDVVPATLGVRVLEGGGASARFSPGSHPTLAAIRRCARTDGSHMIDLDFSENVKADVDVREKTHLDHEDRKVACQLALPPSKIARTLHFKCTGGSVAGPFQLSVDQALESPSGGMFEVPLKGRKAFSTRVDEVMWKEYDHGCSILAM